MSWPICTCVRKKPVVTSAKHVVSIESDLLTGNAQSTNYLPNFINIYVRRDLFALQLVDGHRCRVWTSSFEELLDLIANHQLALVAWIQVLHQCDVCWESISCIHITSGRCRNFIPVSLICEMVIATARHCDRNLFTEDVWFTWDGYFNSRNTATSEEENQHAQFVISHQERLSMNVRSDVINDHHLDPFILPQR